MTESEWLASSDPAAMLECCTDHGWGGPLGTPTARKLRLFDDALIEYLDMNIPAMKVAKLAPSSASLAASLLCDIVGNPFRPLPHLHRDSAGNLRLVVGASSYIHASHPWLTPTVLAIASSIYEERDWAAMPILADALEDAGCDNQEVLGHCRGKERVLAVSGESKIPATEMWIPLRGPHVRGCWVIDTILGKD